MSSPPTVLIVSSQDVSERLQRTVLYRSGIERVQVEPLAAAETVRSARPALVLVDGRDSVGASDVLRRLRADPDTRRLSLAVLVETPNAADEQRLREAGANVVLSGQPIPFLWDQWLQELMSVPPRRAARIAVRLEVWQRRVGQPGPHIGWTLNISTRGLLLETAAALEISATLDLMFRLPGDDHAIQSVGQVVRHGGSASGGPLSGVKFLRLSEHDRDLIHRFVAAGLEH